MAPDLRLGVLAAFLAAGVMAVGPTVTADDFSGTYSIAIGHSPQFTMELDQTGSSVEFRMTGKNLDLTGTGTVAGSVMTLAADLGETGDFSASVTFTADGSGFAGRWEVVGPNPVQGTLTGTTSPWPSYDLEALGVPHLAVAGGIDLLRIGRVSRFRFGEGHDYSDELESCRSMKHYFDPKPGVRHDSIRLFSPVAGTIVGTTDEWDGPNLWKGQAVGIRPDGWPAFDIVIFHLDPRRPLLVGAPVAAGEELGTSAEDLGNGGRHRRRSAHSPGLPADLLLRGDDRRRLPPLSRVRCGRQNRLHHPPLRTRCRPTDLHRRAVRRPGKPRGVGPPSCQPGAAARPPPPTFAPVAHGRPSHWSLTPRDLEDPRPVHARMAQPLRADGTTVAQDMQYSLAFLRKNLLISLLSCRLT